MRKRIPLESYDLETKWPIETFESFSAAGAAGFSRSAIAEVLAFRRKSHRGLGWRVRDSTSFVGQFVVEAPDAVVPLAEFVRRYCEFVPGADAQRVELRVRRRYQVRLGHYDGWAKALVFGVNCRAVDAGTGPEGLFEGLDGLKCNSP